MRITPAYAGKSADRDEGRASVEDHPRLRGEKATAGWWLHYKMGSPPLTRGKGIYRRDERAALRITPAYAGKSVEQDPVAYAVKDHPRLRGEKPDYEIDVMRELGSPPLTRGKEAGQARIGQQHGITPAYAGKSSSSCVLLSPAEDHPRLRGEKVPSSHCCTTW